IQRTRLAAQQFFNQDAGLDRCPSAEFDQGERWSRSLQDFRRVAFENRALRARQVVLRQFCDPFEERGTRIVVKQLRRKPLWSGTQALAHRRGGRLASEELKLFASRHWPTQFP